MNDLDINLEEMAVETIEENDGFDEELEHEFLDKIRQLSTL